MGFGLGIELILLGILGAASLIIAKRPDAKEYIDKLTPYQGWIGFIGMIIGAFNILWAILHMGWIKYIFGWWLTWLVASVVMFLLGALLGVGVFKSFVKQEDAVEKMDALVKKMAPYQGTLGLVSIGLGIWTIIGAFVWL